MAPSFTGRLSSLLRQAASRATCLLKKYRKPLQFAFSGAILLFLGLYVYRSTQELGSYEFSLNVGSLAVATGLIMLSALMSPLLWGLILRACLRTGLGWRDGLWVWYLSQVSRYLPGNVWNYVSRVYLGSERGIPASNSVLSMVLEIMMVLLGQAIVFLLSLPFWLEGRQESLWVLLILPIGLIILNPRVFNGLLGVLARRSGMGEPPLVRLSPGLVAGLLALFTLVGLVVGSAFYFFAKALQPISLSNLPAVAGLVNLSLIVGFLTPFAPYGLGVREGLLTVLLSQFVPTPVAALIALASRLWMTLAELIGLLIAFLLRPSEPNPDQ